MPAPRPVRWYLAPRRGKEEREGEEGRDGRTFELVPVRLLVRPDALLQLAHVERARGLGRVDEDERVLLLLLLRRRRRDDDGRVRRAEQADKGRREAGEEGRQGGLGVVWRTRRGRRVNTVCSCAARSARELIEEGEPSERGTDARSASSRASLAWARAHRFARCCFWTAAKRRWMAVTRSRLSESRPASASASEQGGSVSEGRGEGGGRGGAPSSRATIASCSASRRWWIWAVSRRSAGLSESGERRAAPSWGADEGDTRAMGSGSAGSRACVCACESRSW